MRRIWTYAGRHSRPAMTISTLAAAAACTCGCSREACSAEACQITRRRARQQPQRLQWMHPPCSAPRRVGNDQHALAAAFPCRVKAVQAALRVHAAATKRPCKSCAVSGTEQAASLLLQRSATLRSRAVSDIGSRYIRAECASSAVVKTAALPEWMDRRSQFRARQVPVGAAKARSRFVED